MFNECEHRIFQNVDKKILNSLINDGKFERQRFEKGDVIFSPSDYRRSIGILNDGEATVKKPHNIGDSVVLRRMGEGDIFGVAALFNSGDEYVTEIVADCNCIVTFLNEQTVIELLAADKSFVMNYISMLSGRINYLNMLIAGYTAQKAVSKLAHYLIVNAVNDRVSLEYSMSGLAERLGIGRASLYRAVEDFESAEIIKRDGKDIVITDPNKLKQFI